jgi:hypothetical protein
MQKDICHYIWSRRGTADEIVDREGEEGQRSIISLVRLGEDRSNVFNGKDFDQRILKHILGIIPSGKAVLKCRGINEEGQDKKKGKNFKGMFLQEGF